MARKKPLLSLRRPADVIDPLQADRFVRGLAPDPPPDALGKDTPNAQTSKRLGAMTSESSTKETASPSKSLVYRKRTDDLRRRMTIYLSEDLSRRLRVYAAEQDQDYSVVLAEALGALLDQKGVP